MPKVLMPIGDASEVLDTFYPYFRLPEDGFEVVVAGPEARLYHLVLHEIPPQANPPWDITQERPGYHLQATVAFRDVKPEEYAGLFVSGGRAPEYLRNDARLIGIIQEFDRQGKWLFSICHGVQLLAAAGLLKGKKVTCYEHVRNEVETVGATWVKCDAMREERIVSAPTWQEHPAFYREIFACLQAPVAV